MVTRFVKSLLWRYNARGRCVNESRISGCFQASEVSSLTAVSPFQSLFEYERYIYTLQ